MGSSTPLKYTLAASCMHLRVQVLVAEAYLDNTRCYNLSNINIFFLDNGMDATGACSPENGGCTLSYTFVDGLNSTDRGVQYGPFLAGKPNLAAVGSGRPSVLGRV